MEELLLIDDTPKNIQAAKEAGGQGILFQNNQQLVTDFEKFGVI